MVALFSSNLGRNTSLLWCAMAVLLIGKVSAEDATYTLRYKFQPEQFLYFEVENSMQIVTQYNGTSETILTKTQEWKQLRVVSVDDDGSALLEPMLERIVLFSDRGAQGEDKFDSLVDETPPLAFREVKNSLNKVVARMRVTANGELAQVIPIAQNDLRLLEAAKKNDAQLNFLTILPKTPIRIGESWKDRFTTEVTIDKNLKKDVMIQRTYTLEAVNGAIATIKLKAAVVTPVDDPQILLQLSQRKPTGTIEFDMNLGQIVSIKTKIDDTVFNPFGPKSSVTSTTAASEKLLPQRPVFKTASQSTNGAK